MIKTSLINPPMFHYKNLTIELHPQVYDPAEDSFLLLETIVINPKDLILELGTGCGLIALACALQGARVVCSDINPFAIQLTSRNIKRNRSLLQGHIEIRHGNLFSVIKNNERFNIILFNPPYLPTKKNEKNKEWLDKATNGGLTGLKITKKFLQGLRKYLHPNGCAYFIFSSLSNHSILEHYLKNERLSAVIVARHRYEEEDLDVYRVTPTV